MECDFHGDRSAGDRKVIYDVNTHGWHVILVTPQDSNPGWAYSIGLFHNFKHPEVVLFGLDGKLMHQLVNHVGREVKGGGRYEPGRDYGDILEGLNCTFRSVEPMWYESVLGYAKWFYKGSDFSTLQFFWPDRANRYPWQPGFESRLVTAQPLLYEADA